MITGKSWLTYGGRTRKCPAFLLCRFGMTLTDSDPLLLSSLTHSGKTQLVQKLTVQ
jgi:hypothetical protein